MPEITIDYDKKSRFNTSLNEIDLAFGEVLLQQMRIADPRDRSGKPDSICTNDSDWLWNKDRVFQVDDLSTEDIFDTYLLRNSRKKVDVSYPLLAYKQEDIDSVFWGVGNRYRQWEFDLPNPDNLIFAVEDEVIITSGTLKGIRGKIDKINESIQACTLKVNNFIVKDKINNEPVWFSFENIRKTNTQGLLRYKAKAMTCDYSAVILVDNRDEAQYIRDHFILRCADANIWHKYNSKVLNNTENQIYTVFEIPNLHSYPTAEDKLKGKGYIYGIAFNTRVWATLTDTPLPSSIIERIRMNIEIEGSEKINRYAITG